MVKYFKMKRILLSLMGIVLIFSVSCSGSDDIKSKNKESSIQSVAENISKSAAEEADIKWLKFSLTKYKKERDAIRKECKKEVEEADKMYGYKQEFLIAIAKEDLNSDGKKDVIALLYHRIFVDHLSNCRLRFYISDKNNTDVICGTCLYIDYTKLSTQKVIGIRDVENSKWKELIIKDKINLWDGKDFVQQD